MCAQVTVMSAFLSQGDHCVLTDCSYGGTNRAARELFGKFGVEFSFVDFRDADAVAAACRPNTKLVFSETPANPTLTLTDLAAVSAVARARGALHCCDATFATPLMLRPLALGCDLSLHSTTKYFDGHNMTVGGVVSAKTAALAERLHFWRNVHGNIMAPHTA
jgi:cystathionine beta-lyase/cystathionine gamma-synthase|tara:strand:- start:876 stop:1364 length:489 start_codon:yes stop_codon:yes gene_type:complete